MTMSPYDRILGTLRAAREGLTFSELTYRLDARTMPGLVAEIGETLRRACAAGDVLHCQAKYYECGTRL